MGSLSGLGIGLSFLFGCLFFLGLVAELYYLLWWKKRFPNREIQNPQPTKNPKEFSFLFCWKTPNSLKGSRKRQELPIMNNNGHEQDLELGGKGKDFLQMSEESVESELMRLHNLCGPPRFLFTIKEETKEDLESEDGKSRSKSLSELFSSVDTPWASPKLKTQSFDSYNQSGFNPFFESSTDAEISRLKSSPPPKFKFLRVAEEKLLRKLMESAAEKKCQSYWDANEASSGVDPEEKANSFVRIVVGKSKQKEIHEQLAQYNHSTASQVLPLAISPSEFRPPDNKSVSF